MKKEIFFLMVGLILVVGFINFVLASDVVYIVKKSSNVDSGFVDVFSEMGLSVDVVESQDIQSVNFSDYRVIFVGDERLRNVEDILVDKYPSVIANRYYGKAFGLSNAGISKLSSTSFLKIKKGFDLIDVYNSACFWFKKINLAYYYIPVRYSNGLMDSVATTFVGYDKELGDVIAYSNSGVNKCFFGIVESDYWTSDAKNLFKDCVGFALSYSAPVCYYDSDCGEDGFVGEKYCINDSVFQEYLNYQCNNPGTKESYCESFSEDKFIEDCEFGCYGGVCLLENDTRVHDVEIVSDYINSVNGIRIKDVETDEYLLDDVSYLECNKKYKIDFKTINVGGFVEDVSIFGRLRDFEWNSSKEGLEPEAYTTAGSKTINITLDSGITYLEIRSEIEDDVNVGNNIAVRTVEIVC